MNAVFCRSLTSRLLTLTGTQSFFGMQYITIPEGGYLKNFQAKHELVVYFIVTMLLLIITISAWYFTDNYMTKIDAQKAGQNPRVLTAPDDTLRTGSQDIFRAYSQDQGGDLFDIESGSLRFHQHGTRLSSKTARSYASRILPTRTRGA